MKRKSRAAPVWLGQGHFLRWREDWRLGLTPGCANWGRIIKILSLTWTLLQPHLLTDMTDETWGKMKCFTISNILIDTIVRSRNNMQIILLSYISYKLFLVSAQKGYVSLFLKGNRRKKSFKFFTLTLSLLVYRSTVNILKSFLFCWCLFGLVRIFLYLEGNGGAHRWVWGVRTVYLSNT